MFSPRKKVIQIFSDESGYEGVNRFGCIAKIVGEKEHQKELNNALSLVLEEHGLAEFKFKKVDNHKSVLIAKKFIDLTFSYIKKGHISVHVIIWDKKDSRHLIQGRCDLSNLCRMYYHNLASIKKSLKVDAIWEFFPDEFSQINWYNDIVQYLDKRCLRNLISNNQELFDLYSSVEIEYKKITELDSKAYPLIQLADLFAGLCRTSRNDFRQYNHWKEINSTQMRLFNLPSAISISKIQEHKFKVIEYFKSQCDLFRFPVSSSKNGYLQTYSRSNTLNIWHYTPQGSYDKAPLSKAKKSAAN